MFKYLLICLVLTHQSFGAIDGRNKHVKQFDEKSKEKLDAVPESAPTETDFKPGNDKEKDIESLTPPLPTNPKDSEIDPTCVSAMKEVYQNCKTNYNEVTKGEKDSGKICCAVKDFERCLIPQINVKCGFEAFNEVESGLHGINDICRVVGTRYCQRKSDKTNGRQKFRN
jgi:hypothetical protein